MAILSKAITLPIVLTLIIPTTIFAFWTTIFAITILLFRCVILYVDLAVAVIPYYLLGGSSKAISSSALQNQRQHSPSTIRRRKRRASSASSLSGSLTPIALQHTNSDPLSALTSPSSYIGLNTSIGPTRDYEGVGGWRFDHPSEEEDALWAKINSRLELPAEHGRRHKRSLTGGERPLPLMQPVKERGREEEVEREVAVMSNTGRTRTPSTNVLGEGASEKGVLMMVGKNRKGSASTSSSTSSKVSGLSMKTR